MAAVTSAADYQRSQPSIEFVRAIGKQNIEKVCEFLSKGEDPFSVAYNEEGRVCSSPFIEWTIRLQFPYCFSGRDYRSPFDFEIHMQILDLFLSVFPNVSASKQVLNTVVNGETPLTRLCVIHNESTAIRIAKILFTYGADSRVPNKSGNKPTFLAEKRGRSRLSRLFQETENIASRREHGLRSVDAYQYPERMVVDGTDFMSSPIL